MAEVTSGTPTNPLTVIVLDTIEVERLIGCLLDQRAFADTDPHLSGLLDALWGPSDLCGECGLEPGDLDCGCRCDCWHKSGRTYQRLDGLCGPTSSGHSM